MAYYFYIDKVLFPVTPAKFQLRVNNKNETVTLINEGEVNLIKSPGLTDIDVDELILPLYQNYPFAVYEGGQFQSADYYLDKLEAWKTGKKPHTCILSRVSPNGAELLFDTNIRITIEDYEIVEDAEKQGMDITVKLSMKQYKDWGAKKLKITKNKKTGKKKASKKKTRKNTKKKKKTYVVKKGDTLRSIAKKQLGSSSKANKIYSLNKKTIDRLAAKAHKSPRVYLKPGTKLKLPK
nr:MAG TPA: tail assembly protein [Caudoviricetes sp.]